MKNSPKKPETEFAFQKKNYMLLLIGIGVIILGFMLMAGGGSPNPNEFSEEIFSHRRITAAPLIVLAGFGVVGYAIMYKGKKDNAGQQS